MKDKLYRLLTVIIIGAIIVFVPYYTGKLLLYFFPVLHPDKYIEYPIGLVFILIAYILIEGVWKIINYIINGD